MTTFSQDSDPHPTFCSELSERASHRGGFTLVEIMAATGIMVAVILLVLSLTTNVLNTWNFSSGQLAQNYEARIALDFLSQDLEAATFRNNGMAWMEVSYDTVGDSTNQTLLYFFSPVTDRPRSRNSTTNVDGNGNPTAESIAGDICAIAYMTAFQNPFTGDSSTNAAGGDRPKYGLYRTVIDAEHTFDIALSLESFANADDGSSHPISEVWTDGSLYTYDEGGSGATVQVDADSNTNPWTLDRANYLSANVANFQVIFYYEDSNGVVKAITSNEQADGTPLAFIVADGIYISNSAGTIPTRATNSVNGHLVYADIKMTVLGDEGANLVAIGQWGDTGLTWDEFLLTYGETFTRRVYIMSNPI